MAPAVADLTESQIDILLREAEERLAAKGSEVELATSSSSSASNPFQLAVTKAAAKKEAAVANKDVATALKKANSVALRIVEADKKKDKKNPESAGPDWFGLQKTVLTPEAKRDFQILRMRGILDPKQHFRKDTRKDMIPKFSVFGTIVEGTAKGETDRLTRKERKRTIAEEVLATQSSNKVFKKRYLKIQEKNQSGKKGFYKKLVAQRRRRP